MEGQLNKYYVFLDNGYLSRDTVWRSFWGIIWAQPKYPPQALLFTAAQCTDLIKPLYERLLPKIGVVGSLPKVYRHSSAKYLALGLPDMYLQKKVSKIHALLSNYQSAFHRDLIQPSVAKEANFE